MLKNKNINSSGLVIDKQTANLTIKFGVSVILDLTLASIICTIEKMKAIN